MFGLAWVTMDWKAQLSVKDGTGAGPDLLEVLFSQVEREALLFGSGLCGG